MTIPTGKQQAATAPTVEPSIEGFREAMADVLSIAETLAPHCLSTEDLIGVVKLAMESDSQLKMLLSLTVARTEKK